MAATLSPSIPTRTLELAIAHLTPGSVAHNLVAAQIQQDYDHRAEVAAERAAERYFEEGPNGGYYAGSQEEADDKNRDYWGIGPAF